VYDNEPNFLVTSNAYSIQPPFLSNESLFSSLQQSDYNILGVNKTKIIEKLEKDLDSALSSANVAAHSSHKRETALEKKIEILQKNIARLEKRDEKRKKRMKNMEIEFKILQNVNRNLLNPRNNS
jgi:peptidoglycan hydrolase CwlO-like protein